MSAQTDSRAAAFGPSIVDALFEPLVKHGAWFVALFALTALQTGHLVEHIVQVSQVHILHMTEAQARGIVWFLDEEPVHFVFNLGVAVCVAVLLFRGFPSNLWLRVALPLTTWHAIEHCFRLWQWMRGEGLAGLVAKGGVLWGGLPIGERALHLGYNMAEVVLLVAAMLVVAQARRQIAWRRAEHTT